MNPSTLTADLAAQQHEWLRGARSRLLRTARIAHRQAVLEIGAGRGHASAELAERCGNRVTAVDIDESQVASANDRYGDSVHVVRADAADLPFDDDSFDLVFAQFAFLWFKDIEKTIGEVRRVLRPGGAIVAIEPDYEAMIEYPRDLGIRNLWVKTIQNAGGSSHVGRQLSHTLRSLGFDCDLLLSDRLMPFEAASLDFLAPLIGDDESRRLEEIRQRIGNRKPLVHLPLFLIHAVTED